MTSATSDPTRRTLSEFADALAARTATPGGGSLAAFLVAAGAATVSMAYRFTSGEKYAAVEAVMAGRASELDRVRARALALVQLDSDAYDRVSAGFALPKADDAQKAARTAAIQAGLRNALEVPLETMRLAAEVLRLARDGAAAINPNLASDCGAGALSAAAGLEAAFANVRINAASIKDAEYVRARRAEAEALRAEARELAGLVARSVDAHLGA
jgi:formiminotetrahydrofolate cyclodeaminase